MSDITSLLEGTTPDDLAPIDLDSLIRRSRRRRARRRAVVASTAALAVAAIGVTGLSIVGADAGRPDVVVPAVGPDGMPLSEPVGSWSRADDPPFSPRGDAFGGALNDGRVVVWGGHADDGDTADGAEAVPTGLADGGIFDPENGVWEAIPAAPVPAPTTGGASATSVQLVDDRLAVATGSADGRVHAAVYDVAEGRWTEAPSQVDIPLVYDAMAWDGETLVLVRTRPGELGWAGDGRLDWRVDRPVTLRWRVGEDGWTTGASVPFGLRDLVGAAFDGSRLALWGGSVGSSTPADGAVYDVGSDAWAVIPDGPLPGRFNPAVAWSNGRLVVGGGTDRLNDAGEYLGDIAAYDPVTEAWETLPPLPEGGLADPQSTWRYVQGEGSLLVGDTRGGSGEPEPRWYYDSGAWEQAPLGGVMKLGEFTVATLGDRANYGSIPYEVRVGVGHDEWLDSTEAPFDSRMGATTVATPSSALVVIGGAEGTGLELQDDTWVFDLTG
jgi:hypothetical protein